MEIGVGATITGSGHGVIGAHRRVGTTVVTITTPMVVDMATTADIRDADNVLSPLCKSHLGAACTGMVLKRRRIGFCLSNGFRASRRTTLICQGCVKLLVFASGVRLDEHKATGFA